MMLRDIYCAHCQTEYRQEHDADACRRINELEQRIARLESRGNHYSEGIASQQARAGYVD